MKQIIKIICETSQAKQLAELSKKTFMLSNSLGQAKTFMLSNSLGQAKTFMTSKSQGQAKTFMTSKSQGQAKKKVKPIKKPTTEEILKAWLLL